MKPPGKLLEALFVEVCTTDVRALKPGNVGVHGGAGGMAVADFIRSAEACAPAICKEDITLGERILAAVEATRAVINTNTNLGIILLCAPLIQATLDSPDDDPRRNLQTNVAALLERTTVKDAALAYRAIRFVRPGGMGRVAEADLADEPTIPLRDAMALARERDWIAMQYADGYRLVFTEAVPCLLEFQARWGYPEWSAVGAYLALLGGHPDSLVARKHGMEKAREISAEAASLSRAFANADEPEEFKSKLLAFDRRLKAEGVNPGTTADLVVAGLFVAGLTTLPKQEGIRSRSETLEQSFLNNIPEE